MHVIVMNFMFSAIFHMSEAYSSIVRDVTPPGGCAGSRESYVRARSRADRNMTEDMI